MDGVVSGALQPLRDRSAARALPAPVRISLLLLGVFLSAYGGLELAGGQTLVPAVWPAAGLAAGLYLTSSRCHRTWVLTGTGVALVAAHLLQGYAVEVALGFSVSSLASVWLVRRRLVAGLDGRRVALMDQGDVSRMIGSIAAASGLAGLGYGLVDLATGHGNPLLGVIAGFGSHAAAMMILVPLFLRTLAFAPAAGRRERIVQLVITTGTTVLVFLPTDVPVVVFVVMPMFAWHAYRGTLRESTLVLTLAGVIGTALTMAGHGPIFGLGERYGISTEFAYGVLQLFLLDCGLVLLPLSVMTTQQRMETARADNERGTLERLVDAATGTAVFATDTAGRVTLFNPGAEAIAARSAEEMTGELPDTMFTPEELRRQAVAVHGEPTFAGIAAASVTLGARSRLWQLRRADGEDRTLRMTLTSVSDALGRPNGYLATAEDVTEREAAHRALIATLEHERNAVDQLRELERVKGDFVATVSHELRTPITSIMGYTEVLEDGIYGELSPDQLEILGRVDRNTTRLLLLVEDLLTLSKIESSTLKLDPVDTDLRTVLVAAQDAAAATLAGRALDVRFHLPEERVEHRGDPRQLERMVLNLLTNAVKFTPDGGAVDVFLHDDSELRQIVVRDSGMGIPLKEQGQLFTRFFRSSTATQQAIQGTGLGLTIVQAIVTLHGGTIDVVSAPGRGTTVTVTLPRVVVPVAPAASAAPPAVVAVPQLAG